jgi:Na+-translocating ferredoxin:NAD+ oxidoreductase RnfD subunit
MGAHAATAPGSGLTLTVRGRAYPVLLPKLSDPRLHLAAVITSLQVLGQAAFDFRLSIAQILISVLTCAVLEVVITLRKQHVLMWPASALLTGNGVAFILRVPGTEHGDWWSTHGWWIYAATAAVSLLSKYVIVFRGSHIFNPSNIGLVLCFLVLGAGRAEPLDFWWGPMSPWLGLAFAIIISGGLFILSRLRLLRIAVAFWLSFGAGIAVLAATGHAMTARWHLGPITGFDFWWALLTSPEVLVFLFFMLTDPKTSPKDPRARIVYAASVGLVAALLIAPLRTEYATKVALLCALAIVCAARPILALLPLRRLAFGGTKRLAVVGAAGLAAYAGALVAAGIPAHTAAAKGPVATKGALPAITIARSRGVQSQLNMRTAGAIARDLVVALHTPVPRDARVRVWLEPGGGQAPPIAVAELASRRYKLEQRGTRWAIRTPQPALAAPPTTGTLAGFSLSDVAPQIGLNFRHGAFRFGMANDEPAMMGGGVCWLDYNNDGWLDLFAVQSYTDQNVPGWQDHGGLPSSMLFRNDHGTFANVTALAGAWLPRRGEGCVAADLDGDGNTDLYVTTATNDALLWNNGDGTFTEGARKAGVISFGWHAGAAVTDVNGDGRPDLFVAGYTDMQHPIPGSIEGFPGTHEGVRDLLFLNEGKRHFREVGVKAGLDAKAPYDHTLGALFSDFNSDQRPDLYVANDEDPNKLYINERGGPLGFHFVDRAKQVAVADTNAGMGVAGADFTGDGRTDLFVSNNRRQTHAVYRSGPDDLTFEHLGAPFMRALGGSYAGWGDSWVDLNNDGRLDLVLANGTVPVTNLAKDASPIQVLAQDDDGRFKGEGFFPATVNGRGLAAADYDNDGRVDVAVGTIGGPLLLLRNNGAKAHWLTVDVKPFSPGALVSVITTDGRTQVREVQAGSSYLSSEDPRVHFGLGSTATISDLTVRYPNGTAKRLRHPEVDQIITVKR